MVKKKDTSLDLMKLCYCRDGQCINTVWTYHIEPNLDPIMSEGQGKFLDAEDSMYLYLF